MEEISGSIKGRFVDDDDIVRTGRAMIEIDGWDFLHVPIPVGLSGKLKSFESAMDSRLVKSREDAEAAASSAGDAAGSAEEARGSASAAEGAAGRASGSESAAAESESDAQGYASTAQEQASAASSSAGAASASAEEAKGHASTAEGHATASRQSAEESGRAADRAEGARSEARTAWDGAKEARDAAQGHASTAEGHATAAASSAGDAQGAAGRADESAQQVREIAESTSWDGDQLTVNGKQSPHLTGPRGKTGPQGPPGTVDGIDFEQYARLDQLTDVVRRKELDRRFESYKPKTTNIIGDKENPGTPIAAASNGRLSIHGSIIMSQGAELNLNYPNNIQALNPPKGEYDVANKGYVDDQVANVTVDTSGLATKQDIGNFVTGQYVDQQLNSVRDRVGALESGGGSNIWVGTQTEYNRIRNKESSTLYVIRG